MMDRFNELSLREKILVGVMMALIAVFIIFQFIIMPLTRFHNSAQQAQIKAQADRAYTEQNISRLQAGGTGAQPGTPFSRGALVTASRASGIENLSRIQPQPNGDIKVWLDNVSAPALFSFLQRVERQYITRVTGAQITRRDADLVSAQISLSMPEDG